MNVGCASLPYDSLEIPKTRVNESLDMFNGRYEVGFDDENYGQISENIVLINPRFGYRQELDLSRKHNLDVEVIGDKAVVLTFVENLEPLVTDTIPITLVEGNYIYLKKNFKRHNLPFICGGYEYLSSRLAIDNTGNLIIDSVGYGVGSFMFLIWSGTPTYRTTYTYRRENRGEN